ncbi:MAG TPA: ABC transporter ATP-binding protein [Gammaproteobacteria bacterium]|nr:ABC transporter ATP-binding protein [Gammaproteobacteria bacterium]
MNLYSLHNLGYQYEGRKILDIEHFTFDEGQTLALVGPNGAGKSTLLNLLAFLTRPSRGEIVFMGQTATDRNRAQLRRRVGYVQQNPYLFNSTVLENVELGLKLRHVNRELRRERAMNVVEQLGLEHLAPRRAHELSGGEVQKVALARALVLEPEVLIMDEPFTYLDKRFVQELEQIIVTIRENRAQSILFSSHDQMRARVLADRVCSIINGKLIMESSINLLYGLFRKEDKIFDTGRIRIHTPDDIEECKLIAIEPDQIVLSRQKLDSSMRNSFQGKVKALHMQGKHIEVTVDVGELFHSTITRAAHDELGLTLEDTIWLSFKSSAIKTL